MRLSEHVLVFEGSMSLQPFVLDGCRAVAIDPGPVADRAALCDFIDRNNLRLEGVICTHAHFDHTDNAAFLQHRYGCPIAAAAREAFTASSHEALREYYSTLSLEQIRRFFPEAVFRADTIIPDNAKTFEFVDFDFGILPLYGHTPGQIGIVLPDNIVFVSDAVISHDVLQGMKFPTAIDTRLDLQSRIRLRKTHYDRYIIAHKAIVNDIRPDVDYQNQKVMHIGTLLYKALVDGASLTEWRSAFCSAANIHSKQILSRAIVERNFGFMADYLEKSGFVARTSENADRFFKTGKALIFE